MNGCFAGYSTMVLIEEVIKFRILRTERQVIINLIIIVEKTIISSKQLE